LVNEHPRKINGKLPYQKEASRARPRKIREKKAEPDSVENYKRIDEFEIPNQN
jgi:hypothetical protein